jgi:Immunity protein 8
LADWRITDNYRHTENKPRMVGAGGIARNAALRILAPSSQDILAAVGSKVEAKIRAELKFLFSADADPLKSYAPTGPFGISVMAMIGPAGQEGHESFEFMLCTPEWFASSMRQEPAIGRHYLFVREYSYAQLEKFVQDYCSGCGEEKTWRAVAEKLGRLGKWEFEDYAPYSEPPVIW